MSPRVTPLLVLALVAISIAPAAALDLRLPSFLGGSPEPRTRPLASPIRPVRAPLATELRSFEAEDLLNGGTIRFDVRRGKGEIRVTESNGCSWRRSLDWFAPSHAWDGCGTSKRWRTGSAKVHVLDTLYPIQPDSRGVYERRAVSRRDDRYTRRTECSAGAPVAVIGRSGQSLAAHVVTCDDGKRTRVTWYAPGTGPLAFVQRHRESGVEEAWQRVF